VLPLFGAVFVFCRGRRPSPHRGSISVASSGVGDVYFGIYAIREKGRSVRRESVEGRRNDASQPYRFGSRSVPRRSFSFDFAELVSPHVHTLRRKPRHPYIEFCNRFPVLMYGPLPPFEFQKKSPLALAPNLQSSRRLRPLTSVFRHTATFAVQPHLVIADPKRKVPPVALPV